MGRSAGGYAPMASQNTTPGRTMAQALGADVDGGVGSARWSGLALSVSGIALVLMLIGVPALYLGSGMIDLQVYRTGGLAWLDGLPLYAKDFPGNLPGPPLPFTYPPIAAVLFGAVALLPMWLAKLLLSAAGLLALAGTCLVVSSRLAASAGLRGRSRFALTIGAAAAVVAMSFEPIRATLDFGQVNMLLMGLVVVDCLGVRNQAARGWLVGFAAAIKLVPAVFVLYFLVRKEWRAAANVAVSFVVFGLLGFVFAPKDTMDYWFGVLLADPSRVGGVAYATNQSLRGVLHRINPPAHVESVLWLLLAAAVVAIAVVAARRAARAGDDVAAVIAIAVAGLLVSPISWSHHWVWVAPAMLMLGWALWRARAWRYLPLWLVAGVVFGFGPFGWLPAEHDREMGWTFWQHLPGDSYVWLGLALEIVLAFFWRRGADGDSKPAVADGSAEITATAGGRNVT
ncbi:MAG: DUF2029 domain-containing protein [Kutzneria sp.]|nr:DUF2029 domain-containing protein [Kutzneria sp.]